MFVFFFFFQAEDGIREAQESRGLGDVYKRQSLGSPRPTCRCFADGPATAVRPPWSATAAAGHLSSPAARSPRPRCGQGRGGPSRPSPTLSLIHISEPTRLLSSSYAV